MDLKKELINYISMQEQAGAMLLTGNWGCGKTYLINQIAEEFNKNDEYLFITISLFGIDSMTQLNKTIKKKIFYLTIVKKPLKNSRREVLETITSAFSGTFKIAKTINTALTFDFYDLIEVQKEIEYYNKKGDKITKKLVIIFDDIERRSIDIADLLGLINDYCENNGIKVVMIADETKLKEINENDYNKYIDFKEKVVFNTLKLSPNYRSIVDNITTNYKTDDKDYLDFLEKYKNILYNVFVTSGTHNIRSLKAIIINFERIYQCWKKAYDIRPVIGDVLYNFASISFEFRCRNYKENKYGLTMFDSDMRNKYADYGKNASKLDSVFDYIIKNEWVEINFLSEIKNKYYYDKIPEYKIFLMSEFWDLNDEIISLGFPQLIKQAYQGKLSCNDLISFLGKMVAIKEYEINVPIPVDFEKLLEGLMKRKTKIIEGSEEEPKLRIFIDENKLESYLGEKASKLYRQIEELHNKLPALENRKLFVSFLNDSTYSNDFKNKYLELFDDKLMDILVSQYKKSDNWRKREIAIEMDGISFNSEYYSTKEDIKITVQNLNNLKQMLSKLIDEEQDSISRAITKNFVKLISEKIITLGNTIN